MTEFIPEGSLELRVVEEHRWRVIELVEQLYTMTGTDVTEEALPDYYDNPVDTEDHPLYQRAQEAEDAIQEIRDEKNKRAGTRGGSSSGGGEQVQDVGSGEDGSVDPAAEDAVGEDEGPAV